MYNTVLPALSLVYLWTSRLRIASILHWQEANGIRLQGKILYFKLQIAHNWFAFTSLYAYVISRTLPSKPELVLLCACGIQQAILIHKQ